MADVGSDLTASILIATCDRPESLRSTLRSILSAKLPPEIVEIIVIENGSNVAEPVVREMDSPIPIRFVRREPGNKSEALNAGLDRTDSDFLIFFDDDIVIDASTLFSYVDAARRFGRGHYFGGETHAIMDQDPDASLVDFLPLSMRGISGGAPGRVARRRVFLGFNWAAWRDEIVDAGGFDPSYGPGSRTGASGQETEMQLRLLFGGSRATFLENCRVGHVIEQRELTLENLLERRRRGGIEHGLRNAHRLRRLFRRVAALLVRCVFEGIRSLWRPHSRTAFRFHVAELEGIAEGLRARRRIADRESGSA